MERNAVVHLIGVVLFLMLCSYLVGVLHGGTSNV
jgi:hypothetical protein